MNRRTFFSLLGSSCGALVAVVAVPSVAVASGCIATASNTKFDSSGWEAMQRLSADSHKRAIEAVTALEQQAKVMAQVQAQLASSAMSTAHFNAEFADPCRNVPSAPGADGYDYAPAYWEI